MILECAPQAVAGLGPRRPRCASRSRTQLNIIQPVEEAHERDANARPLRRGNPLHRSAPPARREPHDHRPRHAGRRARGHAAAVGSARDRGHPDARRHARGDGRPPGLAHRCRARGLRQRRADRRVRVRAAHGLARERHGAAGGAGGLRARAARRRRVSRRPGGRLRGLGTHRPHGRWPGDGAWLSQSRHAGPFGAAAAVGKLFGFDEARLTDALGIAGSSSAGLLEFAWSGGDTKRLHLGRAAQLGLESALLAAQGLRGPATVLEDRYGYFNAFSTPPRMERLVDGLGTEWAIEPPSLKSYATHVTQQAVVQAIQELKREHALAPRTITRVMIRGAARIMEERHAAREPTDVLGGQYSLPFTTAVALTRDISDPLVYDLDAVEDPLVRDLARRIELIPDHAPDAQGFWPAEIVVECAGQRHTRRTRPHKGSPANPFTWEEVNEKFRRFTASVLDAKRAAEIADAVAGLEHAADVSGLARLLAAG